MYILIENDYFVGPSVITLISNETKKDIDIFATVDALLEYNETFQLSFQIASDVRELGVIERFSSLNASITIINNDSKFINFIMHKKTSKYLLCITGISVRLIKLQYNVIEGTDVMIMIKADKPAYREFSVFLTTNTTQSATAASGT